MASTSGAERGLGRFEAFTDAVFAIALTLLFVELKAPGAPDGPPEPNGLAAALLEQWRSYVALGVSFSVIGIYWLQHHYTGRLYAKTDHLFSLFNLVFLFGIMLIPFPARAWAEHIGRPGEETGAILLAWGLVVPSFGWMLKWSYGSHHHRLIEEKLKPGFVRRLTLQYSLSAAVLFAAALVSLAFPRTGLALSLLVTALYILPPPTPEFDGEPPSQTD
jgi:uncharacterized membrane protein